MNPLVIALLGVMLLPLFIATWRTSLLGLSWQGLLLACIAYQLEPAPADAGWWLTMTDLTLVRGVIAPLALYRALGARTTRRRTDVTPPNLLWWTMAVVFVLLAFNTAEKLVPTAGEEQTLVAVAATGLLLGLLVLATQERPFSQMVGALRIENAIALAELSGHRHPLALGIQLGLLLVFMVTIMLFYGYLSLSSVEPLAPARASNSQGPTL